MEDIMNDLTTTVDPNIWAEAFVKNQSDKELKIDVVASWFAQAMNSMREKLINQVDLDYNYRYVEGGGFDQFIIQVKDYK